MSTPRAALEYCVLRIVPDIERGEFLNVGVVLICRSVRFLDARIHLDHDRLRALWPQMSPGTIELIEEHLALIPLIVPATLPAARSPNSASASAGTG